MPLIPSIDIADLADSSRVLLDVREQHEWDAGHAAAAVHLPLSELPERLEEVLGFAELNVICRAGGRSSKAAEFLIANGLDAHNVNGGMLAWQSADLPIVDAAGAEGTVL